MVNSGKKYFCPNNYAVTELPTSQNYPHWINSCGLHYLLQLLWIALGVSTYQMFIVYILFSSTLCIL